MGHLLYGCNVKAQINFKSTKSNTPNKKVSKILILERRLSSCTTCIVKPSLWKQWSLNSGPTCPQLSETYNSAIGNAHAPCRLESDSMAEAQQHQTEYGSCCPACSQESRFATTLTAS